MYERAILRRGLERLGVAVERTAREGRASAVSAARSATTRRCSGALPAGSGSFSSDSARSTARLRSPSNVSIKVSTNQRVRALPPRPSPRTARSSARRARSTMPWAASAAATISGPASRVRQMRERRMIGLQHGAQVSGAQQATHTQLPQQTRHLREREQCQKQHPSGGDLRPMCSAKRRCGGRQQPKRAADARAPFERRRCCIKRSA